MKSRLHQWPVRLGVSFVLVLQAYPDSTPEAVPSAREKSRYEGLRAHSPFSLATAVAAPPAPQASFAANWYVSGIGRIGDADFVTIKSRDQSKEFSIYGRELYKPESVSLVSVNWSNLVEKSTVILQKGTETARLEFNEAEVRAAPPLPAGVAPAGKSPGNNAAPGNARPGANTPTAKPTLDPEAAEVIRRRSQKILPPQ